MFGFFFCEGPINCFEDAQEKADTAKFARFHRAMLEEVRRAGGRAAAAGRGGGPGVIRTG
jgi:hypothetical protein